VRFDQLADAFARHRVLLAAVPVALTVAALVGVSWLTFDDVPRSVFKTSDADFLFLEQLFADFGSDDNDCLFVLQSDDLFSPRALEAVRRIVAAVRTVDEVDSVRSIADVVLVRPGELPRSLLPPLGAPPGAYARAKAEALSHPLLVGQVLSVDARTTLVIARLAGDSLSISQIEPLVTRLRRLVEPHLVGSGLRMRMTGVPPLRVEIFTSVERETKRNTVIGIVLGFGLAFAFFRRFWAVMLVAVAPMMGAFWTMGALGLVGEKLNVINTVLPILVIVIGFTDSVHLMIDIRHSLSQGLSPLAAATSAVRHVVPASLVTALTTAAGFASLALAKVDIIQRFGLDCATGSLLASAAVVTLVPLLASTRIGWRLAPNPASRRVAHQPMLVAGGGGTKRWNPQWFERPIDWIVTHPRRVAITSVLATLCLMASAVRLRPDSRLTETIPPTNESCLALKHCDESLGGTLNVFVSVQWPASMNLGSAAVFDALSEVQHLVESQPATRYPLSVLNLLAALPGPEGDLHGRIPLLPLAPRDLVRRFLREDLRRALVIARVKDEGTRMHMPVFEQIERRLRELEAKHPGIQLRLTGTVVVASRNINRMIIDMAPSLGWGAVVIFGTMTVCFRSLRLGLISILPNVFPMLVASSVLVLTGQSLQLTSVIVFSICLGIAVDDTIHFLNRFQRELALDGDVRGAIRRTFVAVGAAMVTTTVVLLCGFGSVLLSEMPASRLFGWLSCIAIGSALIGDLVMLPALLAWFVPSPAASRAPRTDIAPSTAIPSRERVG